jgi:predicted N-formylglutamate amidohydrolase
MFERPVDLRKLEPHPPAPSSHARERHRQPVGKSGGIDYRNIGHGEPARMIPAANDLLTPRDPPPVVIENPSGASLFLIVGDHAGQAVPERLQRLGLDDAELARHIGVDIGVRALGRCLATALDAPFIHQAYSRLVVDCNRAPDSDRAILEVSDGTQVPGNVGLDALAVERRMAAIHAPYHAAVRHALEQRRAAARPTVLIALHSFTDCLAGVARPWHVGILHGGGNAGFATALLAQLRRIGGLEVGDNQPYRLDSIDYTIPLHAFADRIPYAEIEVRQDLLADVQGIARWCDLMRGALLAALACR